MNSPAVPSCFCAFLAFRAGEEGSARADETGACGRRLGGAQGSAGGMIS